MNKITYIFSGGRIDKSNDLDYSEDFFYGYRFLKEKYSNLSVIEFKNTNGVLKKVEYYLSKFLSLPLYIFSIVSTKNIQTIKETNKLILVTESAGFSALLPLIFFKKKYNIQTYMFVMGLYSKTINIKLLKWAHDLLISLLVTYIDKLYFLGIEEYSIASRKIKNQEKLMFMPFHIDYSFWNSQLINLENNKDILFIGNDGNRDFSLLINIAKIMPHRNFIFITSNNLMDNLKMDNVKIVKGSWGSGPLNDLDLKNLYVKSRMVILPLKNSTQPSGQSVTLQSMSVGVPVLISKNKGFWDNKNFINNENIFFEETTNVESWANKIDSLYENTKLLNTVSKNACELVRKKYNVNEFNNFFLKELSINADEEQ
ncbi:glycosyltransferase [Candidatus Actinomarina]|nr:glycosyltransferase [Candidatus Actinomarina sp.]|tara:strand:+ start:455 stop:1567 length:1113 start_codon:yes stop_codon:yes gene_type:complete